MREKRGIVSEGFTCRDKSVMWRQRLRALHLGDCRREPLQYRRILLDQYHFCQEERDVLSMIRKRDMA